MENEDNFDFTQDMEEPCQCDCGKWFDLQDGDSSMYSNKIICEECGDKEEAEEERQIEIDDIEQDLDDAFYTIKQCIRRANKIGYSLKTDPKEWASRDL